MIFYNTNLIYDEKKKKKNSQSYKLNFVNNIFNVQFGKAMLICIKSAKKNCI